MTPRLPGDTPGRPSANPGQVMPPLPVVVKESFGSEATVLVCIERQDATYSINFKYALPNACRQGGYTYVVVSRDQIESSWTPDEFASAAFQQFNPSMVIVSRWASDTTVALALACQRKSVPLVFHLDDILHSLPESLGKKYQDAYGPKYRESLAAIVQACNQIWASTPILADQLEAVFPHVRVSSMAGLTYLKEAIKTGGVGLELKRRLHKLRRGYKKIVIGYMGSSGHQEELNAIAPALRSILTESDDRMVEIVGCGCPPELADLLDKKVFRYGPVGSYEGLLRLLYELNWDLGLVPLFDNTLNRCKTYTKFVEYTAAGIPTLASAVGMYARLGEHEVCGLVHGLDDWGGEIRQYVFHAERRQTILKSARIFCESQYPPEIVGGSLLGKIEHVFGACGGASECHH